MQKAQRTRNITFVINIDYIREGYRRAGKKVPSGDEVAKVLEVRFANFINNYKNLKGADIRHNEDLKRVQIKTKDNDYTYELKTDENGNFTKDSDHMHFVAWNGTNALTLDKWRENLSKFGLELQDKNRTEKAIKVLRKANLPKAIAYLIHRTPRSIKDLKHAYDENSIKRINVEYNELAELLRSGGGDSKKDSKKLDDEDMIKMADELTLKIRNGLTLVDAEKISNEKFKEQQPQFWRKFSKNLQDERDEYIKKLFDQLHYRKRNFAFVYISGTGGTGKSRIANQLAYYFADISTHSVHDFATNGKHKTPDPLSGYNNELVSVAHELSPTSMNVDEYENLFEPSRYPKVNSRNNDKAWLSQCFILAKAMNPEFWLYSLLYTDHAKDDGAEYYYGWKKYIHNPNKNGKKITEQMNFPQTYKKMTDLIERNNDGIKNYKSKHVFIDLDLFNEEEELKEDLNIHEYHWFRQRGIKRFLDDWWQILRRLTYTIDLHKNNDGKIELTLNKLIEDSKPELLNCNDEDATIPFEDFIAQFNFDNHYKTLSNYLIDDIEDDKCVHKVLSKVVNDMQNSGTIITQHLPKLLDDETLYHDKLGVQQQTMLSNDDIENVQKLHIVE